jgi:hypothetical protein
MDFLNSGRYVWPHIRYPMNAVRSTLLLAASFCALALFGQVQFGIKAGANYLIASQTITPQPKDPLPTPKGLGLHFGSYAKIPFSEMVGLRPELVFSFRRAKSSGSTTQTGLQLVDQNNQQVGTVDLTTETNSDQRLQYFQLALPLTLNPSPNFRVMCGPAIGFLMGGKLNEDVTQTIKGTANGQPYNPEPTFQASEKKGSAATKDFTKAEVAVVAGVGYELGMGVDFDLRYYRAIVPTQDISQSSVRYKAFSNLIEFSVGYTFGN